MEMDKNLNNYGMVDDLIIKYLNHQITQDEVSELKSWISESEENQRYFMEVQYLWNHAGVKNKPDINIAFQRFKTRLQKEPSSKSRKRLVRFYPVLRYAAILIITFALGGLTYYFINHQSNNNNKSNLRQYSICVPYGAKTRIELPDKSIVWLNAGSKLKFSKNYGQKNRDVQLSGEGYFEVKHNAAKPFEVHTNHATITDLGTKFDVKAYSDDPDLSITLLKGSVKLTTVYDPGQVFMLKPDQSAIINKERKNVIVKQIVTSNAVAWIKGKIVFDEVLFGNIVHQLERGYNVKIIIKDPELNNLRFYGDFKNAQSIQDILNIMTANKEFHYKMKNNVITVY